MIKKDRPVLNVRYLKIFRKLNVSKFSKKLIKHLLSLEIVAYIFKPVAFELYH